MNHRQLIVIQHIPREGPGLFEVIAKELGFEVNVFRMDLNHPLPKPKKTDLLLIMGGHMGVKDINNPLYNWMQKEVFLIQEAIKSGVGVIGICLGAQLLAHASGGGIEKLLEERSGKPLPEIGWSKIIPVSENKNEEISQYFKAPLDVLHWHGDRILLPKNSHLLGSSNRCKEQFFKIGNRAYGLQCHIETNEMMVQEWINKDKEFIYSGLGENGLEILRREELIYEGMSESSRKDLIRGLLTILT